MLTRYTRRFTGLAAAGVLAMSVAGTAPGAPPSPARDTALAMPQRMDAAAVELASAAPAGPVDESKVPHYFGPYPNWANSPLTVPDATVSIVPAAVAPVTVGNALVNRSNATDFAIPPASSSR